MYIDYLMEDVNTELSQVHSGRPDIAQKLVNAVNKKDIKGVRSCIMYYVTLNANALATDQAIKALDQAIRYSLRNGISESELFEPFRSDVSYTEDKSKWYSSYLLSQSKAMRKNFSKKRLKHIADVRQYVQHNIRTSRADLLEPEDRRPNKSDAALIAGGAVAAAGLGVAAYAKYKNWKKKKDKENQLKLQDKNKQMQGKNIKGKNNIKTTPTPKTNKKPKEKMKWI